MRNIIQWAMLVSLLGLFVTAMGCTTTVRGEQITADAAIEKIKTRDDAIRVFGALVPNPQPKAAC